MIVQFRKGDTFRIAIELFVLLVRQSFHRVYAAGRTSKAEEDARTRDSHFFLKVVVAAARSRRGCRNARDIDGLSREPQNERQRVSQSFRSVSRKVTPQTSMTRRPRGSS